MSNLIWFVLAIATTLLGLAFKTKMIKINLIGLLVGLPFFLRLVAFNAPEKPTDDSLRITSFNTYALGALINKNTSSEIDYFLDTSNTDCAALIEWRFSRGKIDKKRFPYQFKIRHGEARDNGILMVSKYPIVNSGMVPFRNPSYNMAGFIDIKTDSQVVRVYGIHLETTRLKPYHYHTLKKLGFDPNYTENAKNIVQHLKYSMQLRAEQVEVLQEHINGCEHPTIIIGDFNDTPQSYAYQQLRKGKKDAFAEAGSGFESTYLKPFPMLRIDHILYDESMDCKAYSSTNHIFSDHKLIFADLDL